MQIPGEGNLFTAKPEPLLDLLSGIHKHRIALPNFQRGWVWEPPMVRDLLISVAYRYPAGSILTMPVTNSSFALRPFEGSGETLKDKPTLMVLDGQQRLTSLYQALYRREGVQIRNRTYHFYLDVYVLMSDPDGSIDVGDPYFEQALFYVEEKNGHRIRYEGLKPLYELNTREQELAAGALSLAYTFDIESAAEWKTQFLIRQAQGQMERYIELNEKWERLVRPWLDRIRNYPFPVIELRADLPLGAICHIFEKVNSTGVPLDVFDLCTAILWAQGFPLNEEWKKTRQGLQSVLPMQPLNGTYFLQGLALLDALDRKQRDKATPVSCRKHDLMALKKETVEKWWGVLVEGYREAAKFMTSNGIIAERILPYATLIVPLAAILAWLKYHWGEARIGAAWDKIRQWYWCSVFSQRYAGQVETASAQDCEQVLAWLEGGPAPEVVRTFVFRSDVLQEVTSIRNAVYRGVLCLLVANGAKEFGGAGELSTALFYDTRQDHHHIFPVSALQKLGIEDPRANAIVNKTLIGAAVNRSIGGRLPSEYVKTWRERLGTAKFDAILASHLIDPQLLSCDRWHEFFLDRREKLRQLIWEVCGGQVQPFSDTPMSVPEAPDEEE